MTQTRSAYRTLVALLCALCLVFVCACGNGNSDGVKTPEGNDTSYAERDKLTDKQRTVSMLAATDDFGRSVVTCGGENKETYVGVFFFTWHGGLAFKEIYDVTEITENGANIDRFFEDGSSPANGEAHFWGKPVWDYYSQADPWVIRKQIEMLTMAGVDFLFFDVTNAQRNVNGDIPDLYQNNTFAVMDIVKEYADMGWDVPKLMFYTNDNGSSLPGAVNPPNEDLEVVRAIYNTFYLARGGEYYKNIWFAPNGKPMIVMTATSSSLFALGQEGDEDYDIYRYFEFKNTIWPNDAEEKAHPEAELDSNSFSWMETYYPREKDRYLRNRGGYVNVSVAQHMNTIRFSDMEKNFGRGYDYVTGKNVSSNSSKGTNYQYLWDRVIEAKEDVKIVGVTGWNEWIGGKFTGKDGRPYMVDCFNEEYSRDLEPTYGAYKDNFYLQTAKNIRDFKYDVKPQIQYAEKTLNVQEFTADFTGGITYCDFTGECMQRNFNGWCVVPSSDSFTTLRDDSNRNDIDTVTVLHDKDYLYFKITTAANVTTYKNGDTGWMNVMISTGASGENSLFGYDYVINRNVNGNVSEVSRRTGNNAYEKAGEASVYVSGNVLQLRVPRAALGLTGEVPQFNFKVCDNITDSEDILSYYNSGDAAPIGRLGYAYGF